MFAVDKLPDNFLLFVDPLMKAMYQVDLYQTLTGTGRQPIHGVDIRTSTMPSRAAFDLTSQHFYWHDNEFDGSNSIKRMPLAGDVAEHALTILRNGIDDITCINLFRRGGDCFSSLAFLSFLFPPSFPCPLSSPRLEMALQIQLRDFRKRC